ncbi:DUF84 family protein [Mesobacillus zeae]|uniref:Probable inosine/xanthosine triphosphatase n=1 Tax=Mesobacillus zeae TaxID=1917180 RepID=A0A398AZX1_9BACI|nr:DUF84 family protein [Mesobacillus zeae]RID83092.1 DUF84 family protein [Mesobacillus zeae]
MLVVVGSKNPAKLIAVRNVFEGYDCEIAGADIPSGVRNQPMSDEETIKGAVNRAEAALLIQDAQIGIGLEGGVEVTESGLYLCNWGALAADGLETVIAGGARIPLPPEVASRLLDGEELGPVMDEYAGKRNIRKNEGAVGIFTNGKVNRGEMFSHVMNLLLGQYEYRMKNGASR